MRKFIFGTIHADYLTMDKAINIIIALAQEKSGGFIVTPNVDHIVLSEKNEALRYAYADATLSLADGKPLLWMSWLAGFPLPEKISGSDLVRPLLEQSSRKGLKIYFLGAAPGVGASAVQILLKEMPNLKVVGIDSPPIGFDKDAEIEEKIMEKMLAAEPDIVFLALGAPKQEIVMHRWYKKGVKQVMLGVGASLDFISGKIKRSPKWMSNMGLEWLYRISQDPKRLVKRYLIQDMAIIKIFLNIMRKPREQRILYSEDNASTLDLK